MTFQQALSVFTIAAQEEAAAMQELQRVEKAVSTGEVTRGDLADAYDLWLIAIGAKQRAEVALARGSQLAA